MIETAANVGSIQELRAWSQSQPDREPPPDHATGRGRSSFDVTANASAIASGDVGDADDEGGGVSGEGSRTSSNPYRNHGFGSVTDVAQVGWSVGQLITNVS